MIENGLPVGTLTGAGDAVLQLRVRGDSKVEYVVNGIVEQVSTRTITSFPLYVGVTFRTETVSNSKAKERAVHRVLWKAL